MRYFIYLVIQDRILENPFTNQSSWLISVASLRFYLRPQLLDIPNKISKRKEKTYSLNTFELCYTDFRLNLVIKTVKNGIIIFEKKILLYNSTSYLAL